MARKNWGHVKMGRKGFQKAGNPTGRAEQEERQHSTALFGEQIG
jgi:hypothetical protein